VDGALEAEKKLRLGAQYHTLTVGGISLPLIARDSNLRWCVRFGRIDSTGCDTTCSLRDLRRSLGNVLHWEIKTNKLVLLSKTLLFICYLYQGRHTAAAILTAVTTTTTTKPFLTFYLRCKLESLTTQAMNRTSVVIGSVSWNQFVLWPLAILLESSGNFESDNTNWATKLTKCSRRTLHTSLSVW